MPGLVSAMSKFHERQLDTMVRSQDVVLRGLERAMTLRGSRSEPEDAGPVGRVLNAGGAVAVQLVANARDRASFRYQFASQVLAIIAPGAGERVTLAEVTPSSRRVRA